uniref:TBC1 domain family member 22B n=1 Tax=Oncorhynchus kisutch TaxID=8019 RepID=A0A8C7K6J8_ONCKI
MVSSLYQRHVDYIFFLRLFSLCRFPKDTPKGNNLKSKKASSFHEFARSTNDAWDIDDEDDEDLLAPIHPSSLPSALHSVHQVPPLPLQQPSDTTREPDTGPADRLAPPTAESCLQQEEDADGGQVNGRVVVKSSSEALLNTNTEELRKHSWSGIPREVRPITWRLLSGYLPANMERRDLVLKRKRDEYFGFIEQYYHSRTDETYKDTYRQIHIDIPRTNPLIPLFQQPTVQEVFERILFIWAIRHPASGYVQGINDLVTPFFVVFLSEFVEEDVENFDVASLPLNTQRNIEADSFWCMTKLLDGIQDNYTFAQPGIQNNVKALEELVSRIDEDIHNYFKRYEVEYLQFAFRWMNNLLMRELPLRCTIRLWDTYQAEQEGFSHFHLYVCAAFLIEWRKEILSMVDFQGLLMLLQNLPTIHWGNEEVGLLLAEAYRLKYMFADAPNHYRR